MTEAHPDFRSRPLEAAELGREPHEDAEALVRHCPGRVASWRLTISEGVDWSLDAFAPKSCP